MTLQWKKRLGNILWLFIALACIVLLVAAVSKKNSSVCKDIHVEVTGGEDHFFVDEKDVVRLLNATGDLKGKAVENINLLVLENRLESDKWIHDAELFIDNKQVLQVKVAENEPVARIFTVGGYSYYIDSSCKKLPLTEKLSARVPMFTGFPSDRTRLGRTDSSLMASLKEMAVYINSVPFWKAQVAQIDINDNRELEMVPTIGNHTVLLGKPVDYEEKFNKLYSFYKQVWAKVGLEKYETVDVRFSGQVVAIKKGVASTIGIDSLKAQQAMDELMAKVNPPDVP